MSSSRTFTDLLFEKTGPIATLTLNRPERLNAFRSRTVDELTRALNDASRDRAIRVVILTGAGGRAFSVGGDIAEMANLTRKTGRIFVRRLARLAKAFLDCPKPILARVDGHCLGGGNELQLVCDLTIASDRSAFAQVGPTVGSAPLWGATQILPALIGLKKAKEMMFLCRRYSAAEALAMGLINQVVPASELDLAVETVCREILSKSPQSLRLIKKAVHRTIYPETLKDLKLLETIYGSPDLREGMAAFLEKRPPRFTSP